jgi:hypothetical protein
MISKNRSIDLSRVVVPDSFVKSIVESTQKSDTPKVDQIEIKKITEELMEVKREILELKKLIIESKKDTKQPIKEQQIQAPQYKYKNFR